MYSGEKISLRMVEPTDVELLLEVENDVELWSVSNTHTPYSRKVMMDYALSVQNITVQKQLRLVVIHDEKVAGFVDLFEYDAIHGRCGVGIVMLKKFRRRGFAQEAVELVLRYAREVLQLHQVWCTIGANNKASRSLFEKCGFILTATKKDWLRDQEMWVDEWFLQKIWV